MGRSAVKYAKNLQFSPKKAMMELVQMLYGDGQITFEVNEKSGRHDHCVDREVSILIDGVEIVKGAGQEKLFEEIKILIRKSIQSDL